MAKNRNKRRRRSAAGGAQNDGSSSFEPVNTPRPVDYEGGGEGGEASQRSAGGSFLGEFGAHPLTTALATAASAWLAIDGARRRAPAAIYGASRTAAEVTTRSVARSTEAARRGVQRTAATASNTAGDVWEDHTLAATVGLFAVAVAAGMLLPATAIERTVAGERSARLLETARSRGGKLVKRGKRIASTVVREGAAAAADEADRVGLTPERIAKKVKRIAGRVGESVTGARGKGGGDKRDEDADE